MNKIGVNAMLICQFDPVNEKDNKRVNIAASLAQSFKAPLHIPQVGSSNPHTALCLSIHAKLVARLLTLCD